MQRYYFHLRDSVDVLDPTGTEVPNIRAAMTHAIGVMHSFFGVAEVEPGDDWHVQVTNDRGAEVFTLRPTFETPSLADA